MAIQTTGVGAPATAMVVEELLMSGAQRLVRVASAVGVAADTGPGDIVVPLAAGPADGTTRTYVHGALIVPAADWALVDALSIGLAAGGSSVRHGSVATVDVMPGETTMARWRSRGILALEMGSAPLFYLCARAAAAAAAKAPRDAAGSRQPASCRSSVPGGRGSGAHRWRRHHRSRHRRCPRRARGAAPQGVAAPSVVLAARRVTGSA